MGYKVAIDMCYFYSTHAGGKDEVAYNLLRGFDEIDASGDIVCFCYKKLVPTIQKVNPNVRLQVVPKIRTWKFFQNFHFWFRSYYEERWCKRNGVGMLIFPNKPTPNRKFDVKTCVIPHDIEVFENGLLPGISYSKDYYNRLSNAIKNDFRNRDYIVAISDFDKSEMIKFMPWAADKITRIYDPIRFHEIKLDNDNISKKYITVLNIQWMHKNAFTVVKAFYEIMNSVEYDLILVGNFPDNIEEIKQYIVDNNMEHRVIMTGFVSDQKLSEIIDQTRMYINASYFEGFGMTAIEMMGDDIPTIVAESTAMPEVTMGLCRYYSPAGDYHALAQTILNEINNPLSKGQLSMISETVRSKYDFRNIAAEYWKFINKCIEEE